MQKAIESISSAPPIAHINDIKDHVAALENRIPALESQNVTMRRALDAIVGLLHADAQRKGEASLEATIDAVELTASTALLGTRCLSGNGSTLTEGIGLISPLPRRQRFQSSAQPSEGIPAGQWKQASRRTRYLSRFGSSPFFSERHGWPFLSISSARGTGSAPGSRIALGLRSEARPDGAPLWCRPGPAICAGRILKTYRDITWAQYFWIRRWNKRCEVAPVLPVKGDRFPQICKNRSPRAHTRRKFF